MCLTGFFSYAQSNLITLNPFQKSNYSEVNFDFPKDSTNNTKVRKPRVPWKAAVMSACLPGLGQIYNRKYWKLPIVWGAIGTSSYFMVTQHIEFIKFRDAYRHVVLTETPSPLFPEYGLNEDALKAQRDGYERNRNLLIIVTTLLWGLNVVDATVDAHLSTFDVSDDLSIRLAPNSFYTYHDRQIYIGLTLNLNFK